MWGRSLKITNCKLFHDLSPNMLHNIDGPAVIAIKAESKLGLKQKIKKACKSALA